MRCFFVPIIAVILSICESANILILHPIYCGSHEFVLRNLGDYLIKKGHSVTQVCILLIQAQRARKFKKVQAKKLVKSNK